MTQGAMLEATADFGPLLGLLRRLSEGSSQAISQMVNDASNVLTETVKAEAPVSKNPESGAMGGLLRESLNFRTASTGAVLEGVQYAQYVIGGTAPHEIRPRNGGALSFFWGKMGGRVVFASVHHPGTKPNDFRLKGLDLAFETGQLDDVWSRFWRNLAGGGGG